MGTTTTLNNLLNESLTERGESGGEIQKVAPVSGGCIHQASRITLRDGRNFFVKSSSHSQMLKAEADGLELLHASFVSGAIAMATPKLLGLYEKGGQGFLFLSWIEPEHAGPYFFHQFGKALASWHRHTAALNQERYGLPVDNFIGLSPQANKQDTDWVQFFAVHRLGFQLDLLRKNSQQDQDLNRKVTLLMDRLDDFLAADVDNCLLHGDLWSGNYLCGDADQAILIDPAVYWGDRETDLAMTRLFGGFSSDFYESYEATWPLPDGASIRLDIYQLYHLLNHLNLFGSGYLGQCHQVVDRILRQ